MKAVILNSKNILLLLLYFGSNKCRLGEQKRILLKNMKNLTVQKGLTASVYVQTLVCVFMSLVSLTIRTNLIWMSFKNNRLHDYDKMKTKLYYYYIIIEI